MLRPPRALRHAALAALGLAAVLPALVVAQPVPAPRPTGISPSQAVRSARPAPGEGVVLEGPIDAQEYLVGPGDQFAISIGGTVPRQFAASVSADGVLVIPEAGSFPTAGRTLAAVRAEVRAALQRRFSNVPTDVALAVPRQFYVHVSGAVPSPGRHVVRSVARVEDALGAATGEFNPRDLGLYDTPANRDYRWPALRNVLVVHTGGTEDRVDLVSYFATGDVRYNPYLRDGDAVHLPTFNPVLEGASVNGAVPSPGVYDVRADDAVLDLLIAAGWSGTGPGAAVAGIRLTRLDGGGPRTLTLEEAARTPLRPRDQLYVIEADSRAGLASALGAVLYPGVYPIRDGETTLAELVAMAGGLRDDALLRGAYLLRPSPLRADTTDTTLVNPLGDLDYLSRRFLLQEIERAPSVAVDLDRAMRGEITVPLRDGDRLVVPHGADGVRVFGQVLQPGYVPFTPGQTAADYVRAAGGAGPAATEVYLVEAGSGQLIADAARAVEPGDAVFVARRPMADTPQTAQIRFQELQAERDDRREARESRFQFIQAIVSVVGTVATVVLTISALSR